MSPGGPPLPVLLVLVLPVLALLLLETLDPPVPVVAAEVLLVDVPLVDEVAPVVAVTPVGPVVVEPDPLVAPPAPLVPPPVELGELEPQAVRRIVPATIN